MRFSTWLSFFAASMFTFLVVVACGRTSLEPETLGDGGPTTPKACSASTGPTGCCDSSGTCRTGGDNRACGSAGGRCNDCVAQGFTTCTATKVCARDDSNCGPQSCSTGCCGSDSG